MSTATWRGRSGERGQSMIEFAMVLPFIVVLSLGVVEVSWALLDAHVVTRLAREGSNLISRDASLQEAAQAMQSMSTRPVDFNNGSKLIFSVLRNIDATGTTNHTRTILYQRYEYGSMAAGASKLAIQGSGSFGGAPDFQATNANSDTGLRVTTLPAGLTLTLGGTVYVTEVFSPHPLITPFDRFGISLPQMLYSIAYF
jgi:Flp pilus assembly protein TadG